MELGLVVLTSSDKKEFYMRAFSGEVSRHIASFLDGDHDSIPTIYKMLEDVCEANELLRTVISIGAINVPSFFPSSPLT